PDGYEPSALTIELQARSGKAKNREQPEIAVFPIDKRRQFQTCSWDFMMAKRNIKFLLLLIFGAFMTTGTHAQDLALDAIKGPTTQVYGTGKVRGRPDIASLSVGVTTEDEDVQKAVAENSSAAQRIIAELTKSGIDPRDIQTQNFSVFPQYKHTKDGEPAPQTLRVSNTVEITVRNLEKLGSVLAQVVGAGSNQINGLNFSFSDPLPLVKQARQQAIEDARQRAETYAGSAGARLGALKLIVEQPEGG